MLSYCDVIDTRAGRQQLEHHNDWLFPRGCYGRFLSTMVLRTVIFFVTPVFQHGASLVLLNDEYFLNFHVNRVIYCLIAYELALI